MPPEMEERLTLMFEAVSRVFDRHRGSRKSCPSYAFILNKLCSLLGQHAWAERFPLVKTKSILYAMDCFWRDVCADLGWPFESSF
jgi:hypothetical protein